MKNNNLYVSLRCGKVKQSAETAMHNHNMRASSSKKESNVDGDRSHLNKLILGDKNTVKKVNERIENNVKRKVKADANRVLEFVFSASPEYFYDFEKLGLTREIWDNLTPDYDNDYHKKIKKVFNTLDQNKLDGFTEAVKKFCKNEFGENVINLVLHMDEKTPHFHCTVTPIVDGKLTAKEYFTPAKAKRWQTVFAKECEHLGLKRGESTEKKHQTIKDGRMKAAENRAYNRVIKDGKKYIEKRSDELATEKLDNRPAVKKIGNFIGSIRTNTNIKVRKQTSTLQKQLEQKDQIIETLTTANTKWQKAYGEIINKNSNLIDKNNQLIDKNNSLVEKYNPKPKSQNEPQSIKNESPNVSIDFEPSDNGGASVSTTSIEEAQSNYKKAVSQYGANSQQAQQAAVQLSGALKAVEEQRSNSEKQRYENAINKARKTKI